MPLPEENLEREFEILSLTLDLQQHPERAVILAVNYYEDYLNLAEDYKLLRAEFEALQKENIRLKSRVTSSPVSLPSFVNFNLRAS